MRLSLLLLLAACSGDTPDDTHLDDTDADTDTADADTDTDSDADMDSDTEAPVTPHDCLDNHGIFGSSSTWSYAWKNSSRTGGRSVSVTAYNNATNTATLRVQDSWTDAAATFSAVRVKQLRCDASYLYVVSETLDSTFDVGFGAPTETSNTYTYDTPVRVQANETLAAPNPTLWTKQTTGNRVDIDGNDTALNSSVTCWLVRTDVLGYTPWLPDQYNCGAPPTAPGEGPTVTEDYYWEEGVGVVNDWDTRLTTHTP